MSESNCAWSRRQCFLHTYKGCLLSSRRNSYGQRVCRGRRMQLSRSAVGRRLFIGSASAGTRLSFSEDTQVSSSAPIEEQSEFQNSTSSKGNGRPPPIPSPSPRSPRSLVRRSSQPPHRSLSQHQPTEGAVSGDVIFMAVCNEFSMSDLYRQLLRSSNETNIHATPIGSVLHLQYSHPSSTSPRTPLHLAEAFVFPYGCVVIWGTEDESEDDCRVFLSAVIDNAVNARKVPVVDTMQFRYAPGQESAVRRDIISLSAEPTTTPFMDTADATLNGGDTLIPHLERMAISCALAQSIKLAAFEISMRMTIERTRHLPEQLASTGEITASHRDLSRLMGLLFLDRYRYHLSGDLLVTPAFFWENEAYYPAYKRIERYLEVSERGETLNKRVEVVQDMYKLLGDEISNQNSTALEMAITVMIAFEILLTLISLAKQSLRSVFIGFLLFFCLVLLCWFLWRLYRRRKFTVILNNSQQGWPELPNIYRPD